MFSKETEYALRGLVYIQRRNQSGYRPGTDEISAEIGAPRFFVAKILQRLVKQGFLNSQKGRGGGFFFKEQKTPLTLGEVIMSTEGEQILTGCGFGLDSCSHETPCPLHHLYAPIREALQVIASRSIESLAEQEDAGILA